MNQPTLPPSNERQALHWEHDFQFQGSVAELAALPTGTHYELAFLGRSNCGKSTLINALTRKKGLAKVSRTPGKTQLINRFLALPSGAHWIDLPGYGYAQVSRGQASQMGRLLEGYLVSRACLKDLYWCIDVRRGLMDSDREVMELLTESRPDVAFHWVLTKWDKLKSSEGKKVLRALELRCPPFDFPVLPHASWHRVSARSGWGIEELKSVITERRLAACSV